MKTCPLLLGSPLHKLPSSFLHLCKSPSCSHSSGLCGEGASSGLAGLGWRGPWRVTSTWGQAGQVRETEMGASWLDYERLRGKRGDSPTPES